MEKNQFRKYTKRTLIHAWRNIRYKYVLGKCGQNVYIEDNVKLLRFPANIYIQNNVAIKEGVRICSCNEKAPIHIGENTTVGYHTFIFASEAISIGANCLIAPFVYIVDSDHNIQKDKLINQQGNNTAPIIIHNDVWIGAGTKILKGVEIGEGAVVAAGAIVNSDVEPYSIVGGIPAKKISERT